MGRVSLLPYVASYTTGCQVECYIGIVVPMKAEPRLSHTAALILQAIQAGFVYGFSIMEMTGLPSGTVYPAMRRLERDGMIRSQWEKQSIADAEQRPPRKYYKLTTGGHATLESARKRYPLLERLIPSEEVKQS